VRSKLARLRGTLDAIELSVEDNGSGFDIGETTARDGLGLISMRERLQIVHGEFEVKTKPGAETTVYARFFFKALEYQARAG
jgi:two-component system sensor histidine kinase NreB